MPARFICTACPGEYGPKLVIDLPSANISRSRS